MSITFTIADTSNRTIGEVTRLEPCLCTQMADCFGDAMNDAGPHREALAFEANPRCPTCKGTGVEEACSPDAAWMLNLSNENARALCGLVGIRGAHGRLDVAQARALLTRAAKTFADLDAAMPHGARAEIEYRTEGRIIHGELTIDGLRTRFLKLHALVERGVEAGGVALVWG